jgi:hypothetical protein
MQLCGLTRDSALEHFRGVSHAAAARTRGFRRRQIVYSTASTQHTIRICVAETDHNASQETSVRLYFRSRQFGTHGGYVFSSGPFYPKKQYSYRWLLHSLAT